MLLPAILFVNGKIAFRAGKPAFDATCCCACDCCGVVDTSDVTTSIMSWTGTGGTTTFGVLDTDFPTVVTLAAGDGGESGDTKCIGRLDFKMKYSNGSCQASKGNLAAHAILYKNPDIPHCCYWEVFYDEDPDMDCPFDPSPPRNLNAGWRGPGPALVPGCTGMDTNLCPPVVPSADECLQTRCVPHYDFTTFQVDGMTNTVCSCPGDAEEV